MVRETPSRETLQRLVEEFGSVAHLARELGVSQADLLAWVRGDAPVPAEIYPQVLDLVASRRGKKP
jgi:DNA-binding transcriptional regulator YdaS (Cro superfamily)